MKRDESREAFTPQLQRVARGPRPLRLEMMCFSLPSAILDRADGTGHHNGPLRGAFPCALTCSPIEQSTRCPHVVTPAGPRSSVCTTSPAGVLHMEMRSKGQFLAAMCQTAPGNESRERHPGSAAAAHLVPVPSRGAGGAVVDFAETKTHHHEP